MNVKSRASHYFYRNYLDIQSPCSYARPRKVKRLFLADGGATFLITARNRIDAAEKAGMLKNGGKRGDSSRLFSFLLTPYPLLLSLNGEAGDFKRNSFAPAYPARPGGRRYFLTNGGGLG